MKRVLLAGATAMAVVLASQAFAQSVSVEIAPEQRTRIKEYVVKENVPRVTVKERYRVGTAVPTDVELRGFRLIGVRRFARTATTTPIAAFTSSIPAAVA